MTMFSKLALSSVFLLGLVACAAPSKEAELNPKISVATVKPGASVTLNSVLPKRMVAGEFQTVQLTFKDGYAGGTLEVDIEPSAGVRLFGGQSSKSFDMSDSGSHVWDVDFVADADGVYFLNVFASANGLPRSFSVRLNVGTITQKMSDDAMKVDGEMTDDGAMRVMEAQETIR